MKPEKQMNDAELSGRLEQWKVTAPLPPRFQERVWQRIASSEDRIRSSFWQSVVTSVESWFSRPLMAVSYVALLLAVGVVTGFLHAKDERMGSQSQERERYVQSVDPYQMPRY